MARVRVVGSSKGHRLSADGPVVDAGNGFLEHLVVRGFSPATVRTYAFDLANFAMFPDKRGIVLAEVVPTDLFGYLDWQSRQPRAGGGRSCRSIRRRHRRLNGGSRRCEACSSIWPPPAPVPITLSRRPGGRAACGVSTEACWATWPPGHGQADEWCASRNGSPGACPQKMSPPSSPTSTPTATGRWC